MIKAEDLIKIFEDVLADHWGYIWGTSGILWTQARQKQKVTYMVTKYGTTWQKNQEAKNDNYYSAAMYGDRWIGHEVTDCSGFFVFAYKKLGGKIAHGSNSIYTSYCDKKGKLTDSLKKTLLPGTAVFTGDEKKHGHIGLYVGKGKVIEAAGTIAGVCVSNITAGKWTYYGMLKAVDYNGEQPDPGEETIKRGSKGEAVKKMQTMLYGLGYGIGPSGIDGIFGKDTEKALKEFQSDHKLKTDGICGPATWAELKKAGDFPEPEKPTMCEIVIRNIPLTEAEELKKKYKNAVIAIYN